MLGHLPFSGDSYAGYRLMPKVFQNQFLILALLLGLAASCNQQVSAIKVAQVNDGLESRCVPVVQMGADKKVPCICKLAAAKEAWGSAAKNR